MIKGFIARNKERWRFLKPLWAGYRVLLGSLPWRWLPGTSRSFGPPRGGHVTAMEYLASAAADPRDTAHEVVPAGVLELQPPRSLEAGSHWKYRELARQELPPVRAYVLHGVRFWGDYSGTIVSRDDRVLGDLTTDVWEVRRHRIFTRLKLPAVRRLAGTTAILSVAEAEWNYWHWTMEVLPRLETIRRAGIRLEEIDWFVVNHRDQSFQRESLEELGVPWSKVIRADTRLHLECERLVTTSLKPGQYAVTPAECAFLRERAERQWPDARPHRRLFLSRSRTHFRRLTNEPEVRALLAPHGFEVVDCQQLSVAGQRQLFREAAVILGPHGSAFTNVVYCQPGTRVVEFMGPRYVDLAFWGICRAAQTEYWIMIGEGARLPEGVDPMARQEDITLDLAQLKQMLIELGLGRDESPVPERPAAGS